MVVVAFFAACTPESPDTHAADPETKSVEVAVVHDFDVSPALPDTKLSGVDEKTLEVGEGRTAIIAIERPLVPVRCLVAAQLRLYLEAASEPAEEQLAIYPSHVFNAVQKRDGDKFGYSGSALDIRPRATVADAGSGWSQWDVTDIVSTWISRRPFPSRGRRAPKRGPIVLTLRDVDGAEPFAIATLVSSDAAENAPHLIVTQTRGCTAV